MNRDSQAMGMMDNIIKRIEMENVRRRVSLTKFMIEVCERPVKNIPMVVSSRSLIGI